MRVKHATARCLVARGVTTPGDAQGFIDPRLAALRPPAGLAGMPDAVGRIADAVEHKERIGVFGDYDVDGVTTAALLTSFLSACGASVEASVARRDAGYGFTAAAAADFAARGCTLVITGDCGTSDLDAIYAGAALGVEVIVIDHHTVPVAGREHPAKVLVNPFRADSRSTSPPPCGPSSASADFFRGRAPGRSRTCASSSTSSRSARSPTSCRSRPRTGS